ncbi:unnamed protein product [Gongylonema pulchrum]|uniref:Histone acetyltransferase n=1 Tax=Gongylonema pulchrum TaxID=637853 RepID=A0A3P7MNL3_9BILA|nr:unnamed protein product [Gongylonema pulchrum]
MVLRRGSRRRRRAVIVEKRRSEAGSEDEYYVHYEGTDRRLDEWTRRNQIQKIVLPADAPAENTVRKTTRVRKRKRIELSESPKPPAIEDGLDVLRKEHEEVTKVKNIERIRYGNYEIDTWYFSPYPDDFGKTRNLFICHYCMRYMKIEKSYRAHLLRCAKKKPPGTEIYKEKSISVYEVPGSCNKSYCQCLCLLAKLFLDNKTLYFDVEPFIFYVLCEVDKSGAYMVGYFSKERGNPDGNNLACICILPPFQRSGYGKFLIQLSELSKSIAFSGYELSKREGLIGSPEKPLSDLGSLSYRSYWSWVIMEVIRSCSKITIADLSRKTAVHADDIRDTLQTLDLTRYWKGNPVLYVTQQLLDRCGKAGICKRPRLLLQPRLLRWNPKRASV